MNIDNHQYETFIFWNIFWWDEKSSYVPIPRAFTAAFDPYRNKHTDEDGNT